MAYNFALPNFESRIDCQSYPKTPTFAVNSDDPFLMVYLFLFVRTNSLYNLLERPWMAFRKLKCINA